MSEFILYLKKNKKAKIIILLVAAGMLLILFSSVFGGEKKAKTEDMTLDEYRVRLEAEISDICTDVEGVGKCRVYITLERGTQNVYKGSAVIETKPPRVLGVTVVCRGADSPAVRADLTEMLTALFDIGSNRVSVLKLN